MAKIVSLAFAGVASALVAVAFATISFAQTTRPNITMQGPAEPGTAAGPRDAFGRPCLDVEAAARAHVVNPEMLDHVVSIKNNCPKPIKAKVCYFNSDRCNDLDIQGYKRLDTILGSMKGVSYFRYTITQK